MLTFWGARDTLDAHAQRSRRERGGDDGGRIAASGTGTSHGTTPHARGVSGRCLRCWEGLQSNLCSLHCICSLQLMSGV